MAGFRALTIQGGLHTQIGSTDYVQVGLGIDTNVAQIMTLGVSLATQVHVVPALTITGLTAPGGGLLVTGTGTFNNDVVVTGVTTLNNDLLVSGISTLGDLVVNGTSTLNDALTQSGGAFNLTGNAFSNISTSAGTINVTANGLLDMDSVTTLVQLGATTATGVTIGHGAVVPILLRGAVSQTIGTYTYTGNGWVVNANGASALTTTAGPLNIDAFGTLSIGATTQTSLSLGRAGSPSRLDGSALAFFNGTAPVAKQSITGILSAVVDVNARNVLTSIIAALSAATGYNLVNNTTT